MVTYAQLRREMTDQLADAGVVMPELEATELLRAATGIQRRDLPLHLPKEVEQGTLLESKLALERRLNGEPLAYIIGEWDFCNLTLTVTADVLIPRIDTELLAELAWALLEAKPTATVLDLCCGSGCIGLSIAKKFREAQVTLCDVSEDALDIARHNIKRNQVANVALLKHDLLSGPPPGRYDLVVCNPPYIPSADLATLDSSVRDYEPHLALDGGADGLDFYRALAGCFDRLVSENGALLMECGIGQAQDVAALFGDCRAEIFRDTQQIERVVQIHKIEG